ncbi:PqqD family peptide modification chaperone [Planctomycetota bacterium]|nr:PqqD family peptide modification chaperone [Planctomycetota bacterium]
MSEFSEGSLVRSPDFVVRTVGPEHVLVPLRTPMPADVLMFVLDGPVAALLWDALAAPRSLEDLVGHVLAEFDVRADVARTEVAVFVDQLIELGAVSHQDA